MLNDLKIKRLKPIEKVFRVADHSGLCLEIRPSGGKYWRFRYRYLTKANMLTIGQYPEISLAEARLKTLEFRKQLANGVDPSSYQQEELLKTKDVVSKDQEELESASGTTETINEDQAGYTEGKLKEASILFKSSITESEDWDNVGLCVGEGNQEILKVQISLDITDDVIENAICNGVNLIITHHPMIFKGIKSVSDTTKTGQQIIKLIKNGISVYTMQSYGKSH